MDTFNSNDHFWVLELGLYPKLSHLVSNCESQRLHFRFSNLVLECILCIYCVGCVGCNLAYNWSR